MTITRILTSVAFVAAFAVAPRTADAGQRRGGGGHSSGRSQGAAVARGGGSRGVTSSRGAQSRSYPVYRGGAIVRGGGIGVRGGVGIAPRSYSYYGSRGIFIGGRSFYRPYYSFRPRVSLGFGLWAGYPIAYPYYYDDYYYGYPYSYGYPVAPVAPYYGGYGYAAPSYSYPAQPYAPAAPSSAYPPSNYYPPNSPDYGTSGQNYQTQPPPSVGVERGDPQSSGGVSFEITPETAAVFVDGTYVGTAGSFGPTSQPLGLIAGRHRIEIRAPGYRTMTIDADVQSGQVIPYRGALQRE